MTPSKPSVFEARDLQVVKGGSLILDVPSLVIAEGDILVFIGPNGAGKTTLLQTLAALLKPSRGEILFRGLRIGRDVPVLQYRRRLAMILQEPLLFDTTVYHNVASGLKIRGLKRSDIEAIVADTLNRFAIAHLKDRSARTLSGGEARRVSIARAFASDPEILLMDEPFAALDPMIRETLIEDLEKVLYETHITTIFVTHDRMEALRLASRLGVMNAGRILQTASTGEVLHQPVNEFVASLVGFETILKAKVLTRDNEALVAEVSGKRIQAIGRADIKEEVVLCIRPENVTVTPAAPADRTGGINCFQGTVEKIRHFGMYQRIQLNCGFQLTAYVANHAAFAPPISEGTKVFASFRAADAHVIRSKTGLSLSES